MKILSIYFLNWCYNSGVLDNLGLRKCEIEYDPRFDHNGELINIFNPYASDNTYITDYNFKDGDA